MSEHIEIECKETIPVYEDEKMAEAFRYDRTIECEVWLCKNDVKTDQVGKVVLYILDGNRAKRKRADVAKWSKKYSGDMYDYIKPVYREGKIRKELQSSSKSNNTLVLHWLEIYKPFRKCGYGEKIVESVLQRYGDNCGALVLLPYPLQFSQAAEAADKNSKWSKKMGFKDLEKVDEKTAFKKVTDFWVRMGFKKIPYYQIYYYNGSR